jgi:hypothetical protein
MTKGQASDDERLPVGAGNDAWSGPAMTREMPDQVSSYVCKAFEVIKSRAGDKPDKISDVLYRKKLQYFGYF